jgi:hypothetical protein
MVMQQARDLDLLAQTNSDSLIHKAGLLLGAQCDSEMPLWSNSDNIRAQQ